MASLVRTIERQYFRPRTPKFAPIVSKLETVKKLTLWQRIMRWFV